MKCLIYIPIITLFLAALPLAAGLVAGLTARLTVLATLLRLP